MVRLIDVAKAAGVSHGTASNVFNNPDAVRPALRERVRSAAAALGYAGPDPKGKLLREGKYHAVAVMPPSSWNIADSLKNPVFSQFLQGVGAACDEHGASLVLASGTDGTPLGSRILADRVIFARIDQLEDVEAARLRNIPFAVVDFEHGPHIASVRADARKGAYASAKHLINLGHRHFAILSFLREPGAARLFPASAPRPPEAAGTFTDREKYQGYADALAEAGLDIGAMPMVQADAYDRSAAGLLLDNAPEATAILSMSVMQGVAVIAEIQRRGRSVPGDVSVVGYNDAPVALESDPALTTVDSRTREKGLAAARLVFANGPSRQIVLSPELIVRGSTARAPSPK